MRKAATTTLMTTVRALIVFFALGTLCISESVGLQLLPMPGGARITTAADRLTITPAAASSIIKSPSRPALPRVVMKTPELNRAIADLNSNQSDSEDLPAVVMLDHGPPQASQIAPAFFAHRMGFSSCAAGRAPPYSS
jgi:hypothetical protein